MIKSIARDLVEKSGVDADQLTDLLVKIATEELSNYYYYTILRLNLIGAEGEALRKIIEDARQEDLNHFHALVPRIYQLGGKLPIDLAQICADNSLIASAAESNDVLVIREALLRSADQAVRRYTELCNMTIGKDNRTYTLALAILHEEIEHQVWFLEFHGHGGHPRVMRERRGTSPFVSKFIQEQPQGLLPESLLPAQ